MISLGLVECEGASPSSGTNINKRRRMRGQILLKQSIKEYTKYDTSVKN